MSLQNLTIKSQEVLQQAQQLALSDNHSFIETEHILKALLKDVIVSRNIVITKASKPSFSLEFFL